MPELSGRELLREWQEVMDSVVASAASVAGHAELPRQLLEPMQRQLELVEDVIELERRVQRELTAHLVAPIDALFDLSRRVGRRSTGRPRLWKRRGARSKRRPA